MANDRHTPGPWRVCEDRDGMPLRVCDMTERRGVPGKVADALLPADARLIAAAPDMAAALRDVHSSVGALLEVYEDVDTNAERLFEAFATMADTLRRERLAARAALEKAGL